MGVGSLCLFSGILNPPYNDLSGKKVLRLVLHRFALITMRTEDASEQDLTDVFLLTDPGLKARLNMENKTKKDLKFKVLQSKPGHYIVGLYDGWKLLAKFKAYPDRNPDYLILYFVEFINFVKGVDTAKKRVHYTDIEF